MPMTKSIVQLLAFAGIVWAQSVTIDVPGTGDLWLAGAPPGTTDWHFNTTAPLNAPTLINLSFGPGEALIFDATGAVQNPDYPDYGTPSGPNGGSDVWAQGNYRGLSSLTAPRHGLIGVFVSDSINPTPPPDLDFSAGARELTTVSPLLQQTFYIGQGQNKLGETKKFIVPLGATRLYLATYTGMSSHTGAYHVTVSISDLRGYFPQVADGGYWKTTFTLLNTGVTPAQYRLKLFRDDGSDWVPPLQPGSAPLSGAIPVGGSVDVVTLGTVQDTTQGWAALSGSANMDGMAIFRQQVPGRPEAEAAVLLSHSEREILLPFDVTAGFTSGIAVGNPEAIPQTITADFTDDRGLPVGTSAIPLNALGHTAFALATAAAPVGAPTSGKGVIRFRGQGTQRVVLLGLRFNFAGSFTSLPVLKPQ